MTRNELIQVAKAGFTEVVKNYIDFETVGFIEMNCVYRLYEKDAEFVLFLPKKDILSIYIGENNFIQIDPGNKFFNHYAAIEEMKKLKLIK